MFARIPITMCRSACTTVQRHWISESASKVSTTIATLAKSTSNRTPANWFKSIRDTWRPAPISWLQKDCAALSFVTMPIWRSWQRIRRFWCNRIKPFTSQATWCVSACLCWTWIWSHISHQEPFEFSLRFVWLSWCYEVYEINSILFDVHRTDRRIALSNGWTHVRIVVCTAMNWNCHRVQFSAIGI